MLNKKKKNEDISKAKIVRPMEIENVEEIVEKGPTNYDSEDDMDECCKGETIHNPAMPKTDAFSLQFVCSKCGFRTKSSKTLLVHKKSYKNAVKDTCKSCFKTFKSERMASVHFLEEHTKRKCTVCQKSFSTAQILKNHRRKHDY